MKLDSQEVKALLEDIRDLNILNKELTARKNAIKDALAAEGLTRVEVEGVTVLALQTRKGRVKLDRDGVNDILAEAGASLEDFETRGADTVALNVVTDALATLTNAIETSARGAVLNLS